jgi:hypothetical protein
VIHPRAANPPDRKRRQQTADNGPSACQFRPLPPARSMRCCHARKTASASQAAAAPSQTADGHGERRSRAVHHLGRRHRHQTGDNGPALCQSDLSQHQEQPLRRRLRPPVAGSTWPLLAMKGVPGVCRGAKRSSTQSHSWLPDPVRSTWQCGPTKRQRPQNGGQWQPLARRVTRPIVWHGGGSLMCSAGPQGSSQQGQPTSSRAELSAAEAKAGHRPAGQRGSYREQ